MPIAIQNKEKSCSENPLRDTDFVQQLHRKLSFSNILKTLFETLHCNKQYLKVTSKWQFLNRICSNLLLFSVPVHTDGSRGWDCSWGRVPTSNVDRSRFLFLLIGSKPHSWFCGLMDLRNFPIVTHPKGFIDFMSSPCEWCQSSDSWCGPAAVSTAGPHAQESLTHTVLASPRGPAHKLLEGRLIAPLARYLPLSHRVITNWKAISQI